MKKYNWKDDTMNQSVYPEDSEIYSDERFVIFDDGSMRGSH